MLLKTAWKTLLTKFILKIKSHQPEFLFDHHHLKINTEDCAPEENDIL